MAKKRGFDGHRVRPPEVLAAVLSGDKAKCSELGKRGAAAKKRKKAAAEAEARKRALAQAEEFRLRAEEANEHICPID